MTRKVLITGESSYVGNKLADWLNNEPDNYDVVKKSVRDNKWKNIDLSVFDVIVHVAGIAHQDTSKNQEELYYEINTDLTIDIATRAKHVGVKQFIFISSMIVYGSSSKIGEKKIITLETIPKPSNYYGNSKLLAEKGIQLLESDNFNVAIVRPPMIYGKDSKGNYPILAKFAKLSPIFPNIENQRSMIYIDNLTELLRLLIQNNDRGIYYPQNTEYVKTSQMVYSIAKISNKNIYLTKKFNYIISISAKRYNFLNKIFGNLVYDKTLSEYKTNYRVRNFLQSLEETERQ